MKTVLMRFKEDKFYNGECVYTANETHEVPEDMVERWQKRGGQIVVDGDEADDKIDPDLDSDDKGDDDGDDTTDTDQAKETGKKVQSRKKSKSKH